MTLLLLAFGGWGTIPAGHRGVLLRFGALTGDIKGEGLYFKVPFVESVKKMDVRWQKEEAKTEGASKDLQTVHATVALNLSLDPSRVGQVYQSIGTEYIQLAVAPAMHESIKAVLAQHTAEELVTKREAVREAIATLLSQKLNPLGIKTDAINIVNFGFSHSFDAAIEAKVTAEQNAIAAKNLLEQKKYEADQLVATAQGKAKAMQEESAALQKNPQILQLRALEKWDGVLPRVMSGVTPFIDVDKIAQKQ